MKMRLEILERHMKAVTEEWQADYRDEYRRFQDEEEAIRVMDSIIADTWEIGRRVLCTRVC